MQNFRFLCPGKTMHKMAEVIQLLIRICTNFNLSTVWTSNVVLAELVRRPPRDPPRGVFGGSPEFLAKSLVIPAIYTKFKPKFVSDKLEFCMYGCNYQWFSQKIRKYPGDPPRRVSWGVSGRFLPGQHCWYTRYENST